MIEKNTFHQKIKVHSETITAWIALCLQNCTIATIKQAVNSTFSCINDYCILIREEHAI